MVELMLLRVKNTNQITNIAMKRIVILELFHFRET
jgi:hypothetical protein